MVVKWFKRCGVLVDDVFFHIMGHKNRGHDTAAGEP